MLMLPLVSRGETIRAWVRDAHRDRSWDTEMEFFGALTDVVAAAVHNAVLHAEFREAGSATGCWSRNGPPSPTWTWPAAAIPSTSAPRSSRADGHPRREWLDLQRLGARMRPDDRHPSPTTGAPSDRRALLRGSYRMQGLDGHMRWFRDDAAAVRDEARHPPAHQGGHLRRHQAEGGRGARSGLEARFRGCSRTSAWQRSSPTSRAASPSATSTLARAVRLVGGRAAGPSGRRPSPRRTSWRWSSVPSAGSRAEA